MAVAAVTRAARDAGRVRAGWVAHAPRGSGERPRPTRRRVRHRPRHLPPPAPHRTRPSSARRPPSAAAWSTARSSPCSSTARSAAVRSPACTGPTSTSATATTSWSPSLDVCHPARRRVEGPRHGRSLRRERERAKEPSVGTCALPADEAGSHQQDGDGHRAHGGSVRGARQRPVRCRPSDPASVRERPAEPDVGGAARESLREGRPRRGGVAAGAEPLLVRGPGDRGPATVWAHRRPA